MWAHNTEFRFIFIFLLVSNVLFSSLSERPHYMSWHKSSKVSKWITYLKKKVFYDLEIYHKNHVNCIQTLFETISATVNVMKYALSLVFTRLSATCWNCVNDNITNMSQVAFGEMEYQLFHKELAH